MRKSSPFSLFNIHSNSFLFQPNFLGYIILPVKVSLTFSLTFLSFSPSLFVILTHVSHFISSGCYIIYILYYHNISRNQYFSYIIYSRNIFEEPITFHKSLSYSLFHPLSFLSSPSGGQFVRIEKSKNISVPKNCSIITF